LPLVSSVPSKTIVLLIASHPLQALLTPESLNSLNSITQIGRIYNGPIRSS